MRVRGVKRTKPIRRERADLAVAFVNLTARVRALETWRETLQRAAEANPTAIREIALASLAQKVNSS
jgi:hypothetical protein